ncbi:MAG: hypothetical protein JNL08_13050 [Planctomycetes bacterium]|nr:hypothetical protein [Planctomycetota bacterium]
MAIALLCIACPGRHGPRLPPDLHIAEVVPAPASVVPASQGNPLAFFDFDIDGGSLEQSWMQVSVDGAPLAGTVVLAASDTLGFLPSGGMPSGVVIDVLVAASVRGTDGRLLGSPHNWSFTTTADGATQIDVAAPISIWTGAAEPTLAPLTRTSPDELALAFRTDASPLAHLAAFWSEGSRAWTPLSTTFSVWSWPGQEAQTAADGAGGLLVMRNDLTIGIHHSRDLSAIEPPHLLGVELSTLLRTGNGPTTAWSGETLIAGVTPSSFDWDPASRSWIPNFATVSRSTGNTDLVGMLPFDDTRAQRVVMQPVAGIPTLRDLVAIPCDRFGVEAAPTVIGRFLVGSSIVLASASDGRGMVAVLQPTPIGTSLGVIDYAPGQGWGSFTNVWARAGGGPLDNQHIVRLAAGGAAVLAQCEPGGADAMVAVRDAAGAWHAAAPVPAIWLADVAITADGDAMATLWHPTESIVAIGRKHQKPWSAPVDLNAIGVIPSLVGGVSLPRLIASTAGRFLAVYTQVEAFAPVTPYTVRSVEFDLQ